MKNKIGNRLKELRESIGKSQAFIAKEIGTVAQPAIFRYENGQSDVPNAILLWYADYFDVSLDYIFGRTSRSANCTTIIPKPSTTRRCNSLWRCVSTLNLPPTPNSKKPCLNY